MLIFRAHLCSLDFFLPTLLVDLLLSGRSMSPTRNDGSPLGRSDRFSLKNNPSTPRISPSLSPLSHFFLSLAFAFLQFFVNFCLYPPKISVDSACSESPPKSFLSITLFHYKPVRSFVSFTYRALLTIPDNFFSGIFFSVYLFFMFPPCLFVVRGYVPRYVPNPVSHLVHAHASIFLAPVICTVCSIVFFNLAFHSHTCPTWYDHIHRNSLAPRCVSVKDASILPTTGGASFPTTFSVCESQEQSFGVSTSKYVYWSTIGNSCYPHFQSEDTGFTLSALHTATVHVFTLAVTVHFLVYSGVSDIPTKYCTNIYPDTASFHYRDSFLMVRLLLSSDWCLQ